MVQTPNSVSHLPSDFRARSIQKCVWWDIYFSPQETKRRSFSSRKLCLSSADLLANRVASKMVHGLFSPPRGVSTAPDVCYPKSMAIYFVWLTAREWCAFQKRTWWYESYKHVSPSRTTEIYANSGDQITCSIKSGTSLPLAVNSRVGSPNRRIGVIKGTLIR